MDWRVDAGHPHEARPAIPVTPPRHREKPAVDQLAWRTGGSRPDGCYRRGASRHPQRPRFASEIASVLATANTVVVSGGAIGIDAAAHEAVLRMAAERGRLRAPGRAIATRRRMRTSSIRLRGSRRDVVAVRGRLSRGLFACQRPAGIDPLRPRRIDPPRLCAVGHDHAGFSSFGSERFERAGPRSPGPRVTSTSAC